ncbi:MAG: hypothetical protein DRJ05_11320, partial [Bacteroidetes bacterium]
MLHYKTINSPTLGLLRQLLEIPEFQNLRLVGGTSLALQIGHRKSIDLDLFGQLKTDEFEISKILSSIGDSILLHKTPNIFIYTINEIKVDIVNYPYHWIEDVLKDDNLNLAGKKDISAMKLAAITGRGSKKDFIDLYFLLQEFSLERILSFYQEKYYDGS